MFTLPGALVPAELFVTLDSPVSDTQLDKLAITNITMETLLGGRRVELTADESRLVM